MEHVKNLSDVISGITHLIIEEGVAAVLDEAGVVSRALAVYTALNATPDDPCVVTLLEIAKDLEEWRARANTTIRAHQRICHSTSHKV